MNGLAARPAVLVLNWRDSGHPEGGGSETYVEHMCAAMRDRGFEVTLRCAAYPGAARRSSAGGVRVVRGGGRYSLYPSAALDTLLGGRRWDLIVDVQNGVPFCSPLFTRTPVVNVVHHVHREQWRVVFGRTAAAAGWFLESRLAPRIYRRCRYVTVSLASRDELTSLGVRQGALSVVRNGHDLPANPVEGPRAAGPTVMVLGRLVPHKRVEIALATVARLRRDLPDLRLTVVGDGWWRDRLHEEVNRLGIGDAVTFTGVVSEDEKYRLLADAWLLLLPSVKEGWGLAVIEAASVGTPTVAFRAAGGVNESVGDGVTGLLAADRTEFEAHVRRLLLDGSERAEMGRRARLHARQFTWERAGDEFCAVVEEVLAQSAAGSRTRPARV